MKELSEAVGKLIGSFPTDKVRSFVNSIKELLLGKYLFFIAAIVVMNPCSSAMLDSKNIAVESLMLCPRDIIGVGPGNFYGIFSAEIFRSVDYGMLATVIYVILTAMLIIPVYMMMKRCTSHITKLITGMVCLIVLKIIFNTWNFVLFSPTLLLSSAMAGWTFFILLFCPEKKGPLAALPAAAAVFIDSRMTGALILLLIAQHLISREKKISYRNVGLAAAAGIAGLALSMLMYIPAKDLGSEEEAINTIINSDPRILEALGSEAEIRREVLRSELIKSGLYNMSPVQFMVSGSIVRYIQNFLSDASSVNNLFLLAGSAVLAVFIGNRNMYKDFISVLCVSAAALLFYIPLNGLKLMALSVVTVILIDVFVYGEKIVLSCKRIVSTAFGIVLFKHIALVLIAEPQPFAITHYYLSYQEFGFISRGLVGTLLQAVLGEQIPAATVICLIRAFSVMVILMETVFFLHYYRRIKDENGRRLYLLLVMLYSVSLASSVLCTLLNLDWWLVMLTFVSVYIIIRNNSAVYLIPVICAICMLIHNVFPLTYYPLIFMMLVYRSFIGTEGHGKRNITVTVLSLGVSAVMLIGLRYFYEPDSSLTVQNMMDTLTYRCMNKKMVYKELVEYVILDRNNVHNSFFSERITLSMYINVILVIILSLPVIYMFVYALHRSAMDEKKRISRLAYMLIGASVFAAVPLFITETDFGRWCSAIMKSIIIMLAVLTVIQPEEKKWYRDIPERKLYIWLAIAITMQAEMPTFDEFLENLEMFAA